MRRIRRPIRFAFLILGPFLFAAPALATITVSPAQPNVERAATISVAPASGTIAPASVQWNFGDGTTARGATVVSKTYLSAGTFTISVRYYVLGSTVVWTDESTVVTIVEPRRIIYAPSAPVVAQPVTFTALNFYSLSIRWDFGDGTAPFTGGPTSIVHSFATAGVFAVHARDFEGEGQAVITTSVTVGTSSGVVTVNPPSPNVDEQTTFTISRDYYQITGSTVQWAFGDGTAASGSATAVKAYAKPGTFIVSVRYFAAPAGATGSWFTDSKAIVVGERRKISVAPAVPVVQQTATFTALNFFSGSVWWDFGDGTPAVVGGPLIGHAYAEPGNFTVRAKDFGGAAAGTVTALVTIGIDTARRQIVVTPGNPVPRQPLTFTARNFYTTAILWDFGDGTAPVSGSLSAVHAFAQEGTFLVKAWDWNGRGDPTILALKIGEEIGPRAPFRIFVLQLRFADGLGYKTVNQGERGLAAFADIKYEGTGLFEAQWTVDGMPFRLVTQMMPFASATTVDSGGIGRIPGLPTTAPGIHEVGLRIIRPDIDFAVPVVRYYVVTGGRGTADLRSARIEVKAAEGLKGVTCSLALDTLKARTGSYFVLSGTVRHSLAETVKFGLLRIHLGDALVDQQLLRGMAPGMDRAFKTSIKLPLEPSNELFITLYDISDNLSPRLLYIKKITVAPERCP